MGKRKQIYSIYKITCIPNGMAYIGQTANFDSRRASHFRDLRKATHVNFLLQYDYNKYGADAFTFEVLEEDITHSEIDSREFYWIEKFNSFFHGYNMTGKGLPIHHKSCIWNETEYLSMDDAANECGIETELMVLFQRKGIRCDEDALAECLKNPPNRAIAHIYELVNPLPYPAWGQTDSQFKQARNSALSSLNRDTILTYHQTQSSDGIYNWLSNVPEKIFWLSVHLACASIISLPLEVKRSSRHWLAEHGRISYGELVE